METDKFASIIAALEAGKIPSQKQFNDYVVFAQQFIQRANNQASSFAEQQQSSDVGKLSEDGSLILGDLNEILEAYRDLATQKNGNLSHFKSRDELHANIIDRGRYYPRSYLEPQSERCSSGHKSEYWFVTS
jgi:hypothetical protein